MSASLTVYSSFLGICPYSCAPQWRICHQIPHGNGGTHAQFWCLIIGTLTLHVMGSVQYILWSFPLVTICISLISLPAVVIIGIKLVSPNYGSLLDKFGTPHQKLYNPASFRPRPYPGCCASVTLTWSRRVTSWYSQTFTKLWWHGGGGSG